MPTCLHKGNGAFGDWVLINVMFVSVVSWSPAGCRCFRTRVGRKHLD